MCHEVPDLRRARQRRIAQRSRSEIDRVATACRLESVRRREIYKLSKGYRQRVGLAQALLGKPEVLLLDEPTAGLDPGQIQETREVIRSFGKQHAVLLSTHILHEVTLICHRVAIINQGRLLAIDSPSGLQRASEQTNRVLLLATAPADALRTELLSIAGVSAVVIHPVPGMQDMLNAECQTDAREDVESAIARAGRPAGICIAWNGSSRRWRTFSYATWARTRRTRRRNEWRVGRLQEGTADLLPLANRLLRGRGVPGGHRLLLHLQHVSHRQRVDGRDIPQHGHPAADGDPAGVDAVVLRRIQRAHHGTADDASPEALGDRAGQVPRRGHDPAADDGRHVHRPGAAVSFRKSRDHDDRGRLYRDSFCWEWLASP